MIERQTEKRGPNIPEEWKNYISHQALSESHVPRLLLANNILEDMKRSTDYAHNPLPEKDSIAKLISTKRHSAVTDEDEPWSIASSVRYGLPSEATKDLFDMWRASLAMGMPITIRQAKWIIHIRNLFYQPFSTGEVYSDKVNRNLWLIRQSWLYSSLERSSRIAGGKHLSSTDIDAASFMLPWERATALKLGRVSRLSFPQKPLEKLMKKLEEIGAPLKSPSVSVKSVEQAVWYSVRSKPSPHMELMAVGFDDEVLPEQDDLVAAYWLTHLSKGPLWSELPEPPELRAFYESRRCARERGAFVPYSGGSLDSMYSRQLSVRRKLLDWVKTDSIRRWLLHPVRTGSVIEAVTEAQKADLPGDATPPFNATLLKTVGYAVADKELESWLKLHELELRLLHNGFDHLPVDVRERFIRDEQTFGDKKALEKADIEQTAKQETEQKQLEQEFLVLVQSQGGISNDKTWKVQKTFWESVANEWSERHPHHLEQMAPSIPPDLPNVARNYYKTLLQKHNLSNSSSASNEGGAK